MSPEQAAEEYCRFMKRLDDIAARWHGVSLRNKHEEYAADFRLLWDVRCRFAPGEGEVAKLWSWGDNAVLRSSLFVARELNRADVVEKIFNERGGFKWRRYRDEKPPANVRVAVLIDGQLHEGLVDSPKSGGREQFSVFVECSEHAHCPQHRWWGYDPYWSYVPLPPRQKVIPERLGKTFIDMEEWATALAADEGDFEPRHGPGET